jgi:hypothetical protein
MQFCLKCPTPAITPVSGQCVWHFLAQTQEIFLSLTFGNKIWLEFLTPGINTVGVGHDRQKNPSVDTPKSNISRQHRYKSADHNTTMEREISTSPDHNQIGVLMKVIKSGKFQLDWDAALEYRVIQKNPIVHFIIQFPP